MQDKPHEPVSVPDNAYSNASGTMIISAGDTVGYGYADAMDTVIVAPDGGESSDYIAALRAAAADKPRCSASIPGNRRLHLIFMMVSMQLHALSAYP